MRLVEVADSYNAADSSVPYSSDVLQSHSAANCSSVVTSRDVSSSDWQLKSGQYLKLSDAWCSPGSFKKKDGIDYLDCKSQQNSPSKITGRCTPLYESKDTYDVSDSHQRLSQYTTTSKMCTQQRHCLSTLNGEPQQAEFSPMTKEQFPGINYATNEKIQEILQELSLNHSILSPISSRRLAQSPSNDKHTVWQPQEIQANTFTRLSPHKTRQDGRSFHQPPDLTSLALQKMLQCKAEDVSEHSRNERHGWLLDEHQLEDCGSTLYPGSPRNLHFQWKDFLGHTELGSFPSQYSYSDSDCGSTFSGRVSCCHHSLSSSTDSFSSDTDPEHGLDQDYYAKLYGKPQPIVNFIEDLKPIYV